ncbi:MAG: FAD-dependent oxidoreductase [Synergistaceae bacterium]|jgi:NAD(P)H-nitrite reductase large subunit|nr:FAD-dependent oxidoreductase [Synergistaceae bacterium]
MRHVIIGAGPAGINAAKTIRGMRPDDEIVVISKDKYVHSRCMLHKYISGERNERTVDFADENFFETERIEWKSEVAVTGIDAAGKKIICDKGDMTYDKLLIATGADSVIPPIGAMRAAPNVFGLRNLDDAQKIRGLAANAKKVVIVGAGLVGMDAAYALLELGKTVSVVEMMTCVMAINMDAYAAGAYQKRFEDAGCSFYLGKKVCGTGTSGDLVTSIELESGESLECDMVIVAVGVRPSVGFLAGSGIEVERSVKVDAHLRTNDPDVYAAGDAAGLSGIWPNAVKQGVTAAKNMCGENVTYDDIYALKNTVNFFGLATLSIGINAPEDGDHVEIREDRRNYKRVIMRNKTVKGILLQGDIRYSGFWQHLVKNEINVSDIKKSVFDITYGDFYGVDARGQYEWRVSA